VPSKSDSGIAELGGGRKFITIISTRNSSKNIMFKEENLLKNKSGNMNSIKNLMI
jgi:hypothetical protein